jgi:CRP-like cAMP-binding protein
MQKLIVICFFKLGTMTNENSFFENLSKIMNTMQERIEFTFEEMTLLQQYLKLSTFKKRELLVAQGAVENRLHFIVDGVTRSFFQKDEKEISFEFYFTGMFISSYASFLTQTPSAHSIEAFTPLTVLSIQHADYKMLLSKSRNIEIFSRLLTEELFKKVSERNRDLLSLTATERYVKLLNLHTQYVREIPLKYLASYLNVTPESLSRIRKSL